MNHSSSLLWHSCKMETVHCSVDVLVTIDLIHHDYYCTSLS